MLYNGLIESLCWDICFLPLIYILDGDDLKVVITLGPVTAFVQFAIVHIVVVVVVVFGVGVGVVCAIVFVTLNALFAVQALILCPFVGIIGFRSN